MKNIEQCTLEDLYELFEIMELNEVNLKIARKKVLLLHPDKNIGVDTGEYYEYFRNAYLKLEQIGQYVNLNKYSKTYYDTNVEKDTASSSDKSYQQPNQVPIQPTPIKLSTLIKKYNIDSYPTVKLTKGDVVVDFDSKITKDTLIQFVNSV